LSEKNVEIVKQALDAYAGRDIEAMRAVADPDIVLDWSASERGRDGIEVSARATFVFTLRNRKITRICLYQETGQALKSLGLSE
jgi:ketosteroid isomerase-like protein